MYGETCFALVFGIFFTLIQSGHTLECWKCSSVHDVTCRDHFNLTKLEEIKKHIENSNYGVRNIVPAGTHPHPELCDERYTTSNYNQKNVCVKIVYKGPHGIPEVTRGCRLIKASHSSKDCPEEILDGSRRPEFCGVCQTERCNGAGDVKNNLLLLVVLPSLLLAFLRK